MSSNQDPTKLHNNQTNITAFIVTIVAIGVCAIGWLILLNWMFNSRPGSYTEIYQHEIELYAEPAAARIRSNWNPPSQFKSPLTIGFTIYRNGTISDVKVLRSSNVPIIDRMALETIKKSAPFSPLPKSLREVVFATEPATQKRFTCTFDGTTREVSVDDYIPRYWSEQKESTRKPKTH